VLSSALPFERGLMWSRLLSLANLGCLGCSSARPTMQAQPAVSHAALWRCALVKRRYQQMPIEILVVLGSLVGVVYVASANEPWAD
jgi:hypothetical protein